MVTLKNLLSQSAFTVSLLAVMLAPWWMMPAFDRVMDLADAVYWSLR